MSGAEPTGGAAVASVAAAPLRIGMLGASRIAELAILEATAQTGDVRASVAARDAARAREYAAANGFEGIAASYEALIADDSLDLVYIGLPNALHAEWTAKALEAGRNVLVEKPFASNLEEFDRVVRRLDASGSWAWEAFHYADHPLITRVLEVLASGEIGELEDISVRMLMPDPGAADPRWSFDLAGGAMMDLGCYALHAILTLAGAGGYAVELLGASATGAAGDARVDAAAEAQFALVPGAPGPAGATGAGAARQASASLTTSMLHHEFDFALEVRGSLGTICAPNFVKPQEDNRLTVTTAAHERHERVTETSSYVFQLERVRGELSAGTRDAERLGLSRATMALIDQIYLTSGLPVRPARLTD